MDASARRPLLDGVLVVDLSRHLPGPLVTRILGDLGARVIKVEEPTLGDPVRQAPPFRGETSSLAALLLAGHESVALDLKRPAGLRALEDLLGHADVLVESFRPGTLERLGLAPRELRRRHPRLVLCSVTGFGQEGPHAGRAGHDLTYQALAGSLASRPVMPAVQTADVVGAWSAAAAILAALVRRGSEGQGAWIDQALLDAAGHAAITAWAAEADGPKPTGAPLMLTGAIPCYDLYETADGGHVAFAALEPHFWKRFCEAVGRRDLHLRQYSADPDVRRELAELFRSRSRDAWAAFMAEHDLPSEPVLSLAESQEHPQVRERALLRDAPDQLPRLGYPAFVDGQRPRARESFPALGEHTDAVVEEWGLAEGLSRRQRRRGGVGKRFSVGGWLRRLAGRWLLQKG